MTKHNIFSVHRWAMSIVVLTFALAFSSCNNENKDDNAQRFKDAVMNLDNTTHTLTDEFDYWPECGIRVTGSHLASLITMNDLEKMLPCPLYVSGPHHNGHWNLNSEDKFGHYNPEAIQWLDDLAAKVVADKKFVDLSKPLIEKYLYRQMHIMMVLYDALHDGYSEAEREAIFSSLIASKGYDYNQYETGFFLELLNLEDGSYVYSNINYQFLYFWARRWSDGTIDLFYKGLSTIFKAYYPDYKFVAEDYWMSGEGEFYDEEPWYGEEDYSDYNYVVIDGADLRLRLEPSTDAETFKWTDGSNRHPNVGERFIYLGETDAFYCIDFHGNQVWVSKQFTHIE